MCELRDFSRLQITNGMDNSTQWQTYLEEELPDWHRGYLPQNHDLSGRVVYDFGAGCGETAQLFLNHGAPRVVCIESNPLALTYLHANFHSDPRVQINPDRVGWIKMDIERSEWNTRFEAHDGAPGFKTFRRWDRESNTGIYGLKISRLNTIIQSRSLPLHKMKISLAHRTRLGLERLR